MAAALIAFALWLDVPRAGVEPIRVDAIEWNTVLNEAGSPCLRQIILWDHNPDCGRGRFEVVDYRVAQARPAIVRHAGGWRLYLVGPDGLTIVDAPACVDSTTWDDPEVADRARLPIERRRGLKATRRF